LSEPLVVVKGGGDVATGVAHRLFKCKMRVVITEIDEPRMVRRTVSFAQAVYEGQFEVEGVRARTVRNSEEALQAYGLIPVVIDERAQIVKEISPDVVVDAIMAKRNLGTRIDNAPVVIGLGPGFRASRDVHAVVETKRGHFLGRVIYEGEAEANTGVPGQMEGHTIDRILRSPKNGRLRSIKKIGDLVSEGEVIALVDGHPIASQIPGILRGMLQDGLSVLQGDKVGDVDPRAVREYCFTISDRARAIGGGALEAILSLQRRKSEGTLVKY
jgi:xanthine dehydrogenase accessory factor